MNVNTISDLDRFGTFVAPDVQACVEPSHLLTGTQRDNINDKVSRDRQAKGEAVGSAKLTEGEVRRIRAAYADGRSQRALAREFNVHQTSIGKIVRRQWWSHIT
jgi:hypothetical protein